MAGIGAMGDLAKINTNIGALNTYLNLKSTNRRISTYQEHLGTGRRINRAADSPANYVIVRRMTAKENALIQAQENLGDAMAAMQEADSALAQVEDIIINIKELAQQAQSDTIGLPEKKAIEFEINQYLEEIDDIVDDTNWQGVPLLRGDLNWTLQVGEKSEDTLNFSLSSSETETKSFSTADIGLTDLKVTSPEEAAATWDKLVIAEESVLRCEERIGSTINRMRLKEEALATTQANTSAAMSRIQDTDIAQEQMLLVKENILQQISLVMLTQSEEAPGAFMTLFK